MASCAKIAAGVAFVCPPPVSGVDAGTLCLFNWDDVDQVASNLLATTNATLENFILYATKVGYIFEGINNSVRPAYESIQEGYNPFKFKHTVETRIFADGATIAEIESDLAAGLFVAVYFTKSGHVKVAGLRIGLKATVKRSYYEEEGAAVITLVTPASEFETTPILEYIGNGTDDFDTLKAYIVGLC